MVQLQPLQWDWFHVKRAGLLVKQLGLNPKGGANLGGAQALFDPLKRYHCSDEFTDLYYPARDGYKI